MDSNSHQAQIHWGYPTTTPSQNHWISSSQNRSLKRTLSESDCEELYSEESSKEQTSPAEPNSCQMLSRKKRRGFIEKKRRDRINSSLSELKRLVPSAYEKQGSAKLEKAEILQLTVEHLKNLHAKGVDSIAYDPQRFAMDYHIIGFRECAAEVARYLVTIEGMDIQDPLRLRLMSHLQYFVQQRELSAKACASPNWSSTTTAYQPPAVTNCAATAYHHHHQSYVSQTPNNNSYIPNLPPTIQPYPTVNPPTLAPPMHHHHHHMMPTHSTRTTANSITTVSETTSLMSETQQTHLHQQQVQVTAQEQQSQQQSQPTQPPQQHHYSTAEHEQHHQQQQQQQQHPADHQGTTTTYIELTSSNHRNPTSSLNYSNNTAPYPTNNVQEYSTPGNVNYAGNGTKPYRPWGTEMAY